MEAAINRSVLNRVVHAIRRTNDTFRDFDVTLETRLADDLKLGRIGRMMLGISLEEVFKIDLPDEILENAVTVADIVKYMARRYYRDIDATSTTEATLEVTSWPIGVWFGMETWLWRTFGTVNCPGS
jgi:acyl carrier protein